MRPEISSLLFALFGMGIVFCVTGLLTLAIWITGLVMRVLGSRRTGTSQTYAPASPDAPSAEHLAVIAAAIAIHRGPGERNFAILEPRRTYSWEKKSRMEPQRGYVHSLRRTR